MYVIGVDVGGANLKAAGVCGAARAEAFEIWRKPEDLPARLRSLLAGFRPPDRLAVTMTAELADCFATKAEGVERILAGIELAAGAVPVDVWLTTGTFVSPEIARTQPMQVAAANWHALATWAGRFAPDGHALLIDIGSTTTDVIPLRDGVPCSVGLTDVERMLSGELIYTGARRTPVCAAAESVPFRGRKCPLAAEWFATMLDVYLLLGAIPADDLDVATANGRPATIHFAHDRLARAVCCDRTEVSEDEARSMAEYLAERQLLKIGAAIERVADRDERPVTRTVVSGSGEFLARRLQRDCPVLQTSEVVSLSEKLSPELAEGACAYSVAVLSSERHGAQIPSAPC